MSATAGLACGEECDRGELGALLTIGAALGATRARYAEEVVAALATEPGWEEAGVASDVGVCKEIEEEEGKDDGEVEPIAVCGDEDPDACDYGRNDEGELRNRLPSPISVKHGRAVGTS